MEFFYSSGLPFNIILAKLLTASLDEPQVSGNRPQRFKSEYEPVKLLVVALTLLPSAVL
jgi:hypothetical protein